MKIQWSDNQRDMLSRMDVPFDFEKDMSDDELESLYEIAPEYLYFMPNGEPTGECLVVESIITALTKPMRNRGLLG